MLSSKVVQKVFSNRKLDINITTLVDPSSGTVYFKGKDVASALGYTDTDQAVRKNVKDKYKRKFDYPYTGRVPPSLFITEPGLYALVFKSKLPLAEDFQQWVFEDVLPTLRKTGEYRMPSRQGDCIVLQNEYDLHVKVVDYIRKFYPDVILIPGLGELQNTSSKRITSWKKGYQKGQPDLIIGNPMKGYTGLCIELKTPKGTGVLSLAQIDSMRRFEKNGYLCKVMQDYDEIIMEITLYLSDTRLKCSKCSNKFKTVQTLSKHESKFH